MMIEFLLTFIVFPLFVTSLVLWLRFNYGHLRSKSHGTAVRLTWKNLVSFYHSNPRRWRYEKIVQQDWTSLQTTLKFLLFNSGDEWRTVPCWDFYANANKIVRVQLSYFNFLRFHFNRLFIHKKTDGLELILSAVQRDIKDLQAIANKQINQANDEMEEIKQRLQEQKGLEL